MRDKIKEALDYSKLLLGKPYVWYKGGKILGVEDKFYAKNGPPPALSKIKSIVCSGLINLVRRHVGLSVPGVKEGLVFSGTTRRWFTYLDKNKRLKPLDIKKTYPPGTLILRDYSDKVRQGHIVIVISSSKKSILDQNIIHSYPVKPYDESSDTEIVGTTNITNFADSHYYDGGSGYYTHVCLPEDWLLRD